MDTIYILYTLCKLYIIYNRFYIYNILNIKNVVYYIEYIIDYISDPSHLQGERAREKVASRHLFFWFQKATLGSRLPLNVSRRPSSMSFGHLPGAFLAIFRPELPLNPSWRPWQPSSMSFGHLPGAFLEIFFWFQKATLGSRLPLNPPRRPELPLNPSWRPWRPSSMSFGHWPGAFLEIFFWFQKATLGSRLPLNPPGALSCL